jgi:hypothetical protein
MIHLRGLDPEARYTVFSIEGVRSGKAWMEAGLKVPLSNLESKVLRIRRA